MLVIPSPSPRSGSHPSAQADSAICPAADQVVPCQIVKTFIWGCPLKRPCLLISDTYGPVGGVCPRPQTVVRRTLQGRKQRNRADPPPAGRLLVQGPRKVVARRQVKYAVEAGSERCTAVRLGAEGGSCPGLQAVVWRSGLHALVLAHSDPPGFVESVAAEHARQHSP